MRRFGRAAGVVGPHGRRRRYRRPVNFLAHIWLARGDDEAMLGALLGDFVGSAGIDRYNPTMQREIRLHWRIDRYTDHHPAVVAARALFPQGRRRFAGILLDVYFDHLLARDWARYGELPLARFTEHFYRVMLAQFAILPPDLQRIAKHMAEHDWLGSYRERDNVDFAVSRIAKRLSRHGDALVECLPILRAHEREVEQCFAVFLPELITHVDRLRAESGTLATPDPTQHP
jgi:acyl carrier protein phosphodiesterase